MPNKDYDFGGYATKANVKCTDGRVILKDAFLENDGMTVPLVWQHMHDDPNNVLGHALLENREDGVYAYCKFNDTPAGLTAKKLVAHGDVAWLSIWANSLIEKSKRVAHGVIREVSLVLSGANPGASIDNIAFEHSDGEKTVMDDEAIITSGEDLEFQEEDIEEPEEELEEEEVIEHADSDRTIQEVFDSLDEEQKTAVYAIVGAIIEEQGGSLEQSNIHEGEVEVMKTNVFDGSAMEKKDRIHLTHDQVKSIFEVAQKRGSLRESVIEHAGTYGIDNIDYLFPDAQALTREPSLIARRMEWVSGVINGTRHSPFSRIKSVHADITVETARALGYVTGNLKKEEVFGLLRRTTTPTTIYKKQKLDRDDILDITELDVVAWLKAEMRMMLDEEIARAILVGDGRDPVAEVDDKIDETSIRPIWKDANMYAHHHFLAAAVTDAAVMDEAVKARIAYRGSGSPTMFVGPTILTNWLLLKDLDGRRLYPTTAELASAMRVSSIVEVPLLDSLERDVDPASPDGGGTPAAHDLLCLIVNLRDYTMGADKGGQVSMFDDFDIDYNQYKYLMETRFSGALYVPKSALVIERAQA